MKTHSYLTDMSDAEWAWLEPLLPVALRDIPDTPVYAPFVNALLYVLRTGCSWRYLPVPKLALTSCATWQLAGRCPIRHQSCCRVNACEIHRNGIRRDG